MLSRARILCCACTLAALGCSGNLSDETPSPGDPGTGANTAGTGGSSNPGVIDQAGAAGTDPIGQSGAGGSTAATCDPTVLDPGPSPLLRLTGTQYRNTIQELFGGVFDTTQLFADERARAHIGLLQPDVSQFEVETYGNYADLIAAAVASNVTTLAPCDAATDMAQARACAASFLGAYGPRILRSPLTAAESERLLQVYDIGFQGSGYARGVELMLSSLLQSPRFLYRPEFGDPNAPTTATSVPLSAHELASRLSFAFWNAAPDAELLAAAESGALHDPAQRDAQVARLIADPRARDSFRNFLYAWFGLGDLDLVVKDRTEFPTWTDETPGELKKQSDAFFDDVLFGAAGTLDVLFSSPLGAYAPATLAEWNQTDATTATGLLTLPALLAVHSKANESFPIYRGLFVREQLLCQPLPPPPPGAAADPPEPEPGVSTRVRFEQHSVDAACRGCHSLIDSIGFSFENYDAAGRYRTDDRGLPIDASGTLTGTDVDGPFVGVAELSELLRQSSTVQQCASRQWFRYVMQRFDQAADACSTQAIQQAFTASGLRFDSLRMAVVDTPAFLARRPIVEGN